MMKLLTTILIATLVVPHASAEEKELRRKYIGEGAYSCGAWTFERQQNSTKSALHATWVLGYVSGQNADASTSDFLQGVDAGAILGWIDNYCRSNPLMKIATAANRLVVELVVRAERKP